SAGGHPLHGQRACLGRPPQTHDRPGQSDADRLRREQVRPEPVLRGEGCTGCGANRRSERQAVRQRASQIAGQRVGTQRDSKRSHSVCAQGGINACNEIARQQGYSEWMHFDETVLGGDFLADQPPVLEMCNWAPRIIDLLDRMGVPFNRTPEGQRALRLFGGSLFKRTFYAGATTGQQLLYALDEQPRRWEAEGRVNKYE